MSAIKDHMLDRIIHLEDLESVVRIYLSHLYAYEQGAEHDGTHVDYWRSELERLTA